MMIRLMVSCTRGRATLIVLAACALLSVAIKAPQLLAPIGQDQGLYNAAAERILAGGVPYRDVWDPKPPATFYVHAAVLGLVSHPWQPCHLGSLPGMAKADLQPRCGTLALGLVDMVYALVLGGAVFGLARRLQLAPVAAALAGGLTAVTVNLAIIDPEGSTPEKDALLPAVLVLLVGLSALRTRRPRPWLVLAGVWAGIAVLFKQPDITSCLALSSWLIVQRRWRDLVAVWVGVGVVLAAAGGALTIAGAGGAALDATVGYNLGRFEFGSGGIPLRGLVALWQMFRDGLAALILTAALGAIVAWRSRRATWRVVVGWAALDALALGLGGTKFTRTYFMQLVPSSALLAAIGLDWLWRVGLATRLSRVWAMVTLAVLAVLSNGFQGGFALRIWNEYVSTGWTTTSIEHLADMLRALPPDETLLVWGDHAELYLLSGRPPTTRFLNTTGLIATGDRGARARRSELIATLDAAPPSVIVLDRRTFSDDPDGRLGLSPDGFPELRGLLATRYRAMDGRVLASYPGGDRDVVYLRQGGADLCAALAACRLSGGPQ